MDKVIEIYLSDKKVYLVSNSIYLLMCFLLTNKIMNCLGYFYTYPSEINTSTIILFIISGQIIVPLIMFIVMTFLLHFVKEGAFLCIYLIKGRDNLFVDAMPFIQTTGEKLNWFHSENGIYRKGRNFTSFKKLLEDFNRENEVNIVTKASMINTMAMSVVCVLPLYDMPLNLKICLIIFFLFYFGLTAYNLFLLYKIQDLYEDLLRLRDEIIASSENNNIANP